jgi:Domain of unknown function (DUF5668)
MRADRSMLFALLLIAVGVVLLLQELEVIPADVGVWPIVVIGVGAAMLVERVARGDASGTGLILPLVLIGVGTAFLLRDLDVVEEDGTLAPLVVIAVGAGLVLGALPSRSAVDAAQRGVALGDATRAAVRVVHGAGTLRIGAHLGGPNLLEARVPGGEVRSSRVGEGLEVDVGAARGFRFPLGLSGRLDWSITLARTVPVELSLRTGAGRTDADLSDLRVVDLYVETGASAVAVTIPAQGRPSVRIRGGAAEIHVAVPSRMAARIRTRGVLAEVAIDLHRFPLQFGEHRSPGFEDADDRAEILIEAGAASVRVD